jgi:hypothetical protein
VKWRGGVLCVEQLAIGGKCVVVCRFSVTRRLLNSVLVQWRFCRALVIARRLGRRAFITFGRLRRRLVLRPVWIVFVSHPGSTSALAS